jgi:hypothetical protein
LGHGAAGGGHLTCTEDSSRVRISNAPTMKSIRSDSWDGRFRTLYEQTCPCGSVFYVPKHVLCNPNRGKYCSTICANKASQKQDVYSCRWCNQEFTRAPSKLSRSKSGQLFCSRKCKDEAQSLKGVKEIHPAHYGTGSDYRKIAFDHYSDVCTICGYNRYPEVLVVHHKDRDRSNNEVSNLEILCPTCHEEHHFLEKSGRWGVEKTGS